MYCNVFRDEGKISRKLIECVNTYLLKDGPNLGCQSLEIHGAIQHFVYSCWLTTHDRGLKVSKPSCWSDLCFPIPECTKQFFLLRDYVLFFFQDALNFYARLQLNLTRGVDDGSSLVEQLLDVVYKELDQSNLPGSSVSR